MSYGRAGNPPTGLSVEELKQMTAMRMAQSQDSKGRQGGASRQTRKSPSPQPSSTQRSGAHQHQQQYLPHKEYEHPSVKHGQYSTKPPASQMYAPPSSAVSMAMSAPRVVRGPSPLLEQSSGMPHGLSVQELKELTRMRLAKQQHAAPSASVGKSPASNRAATAAYEYSSHASEHQSPYYDSSSVRSGMTTHPSASASAELEGIYGGGPEYHRELSNSSSSSVGDTAPISDVRGGGSPRGAYREYVPGYATAGMGGEGVSGGRSTYSERSTSPVSMGDGDSLDGDVYQRYPVPSNGSGGANMPLYRTSSSGGVDVYRGSSSHGIAMPAHSLPRGSSNSSDRSVEEYHAREYHPNTTATARYAPRSASLEYRERGVVDMNPHIVRDHREHSREDPYRGYRQTHPPSHYPQQQQQQLSYVEDTEEPLYRSTVPSSRSAASGGVYASKGLSDSYGYAGASDMYEEGGGRAGSYGYPRDSVRPSNDRVGGLSIREYGFTDEFGIVEADRSRSSVVDSSMGIDRRSGGGMAAHSGMEGRGSTHPPFSLLGSNEPPFPSNTFDYGEMSSSLSSVMSGYGQSTGNDDDLLVRGSDLAPSYRQTSGSSSNSLRKLAMSKSIAGGGNGGNGSGVGEDVSVGSSKSGGSGRSPLLNPLSTPAHLDTTPSPPPLPPSTATGDSGGSGSGGGGSTTTTTTDSPPMSPYRSFRNKKKLQIDCPEPVRRRSTSDCNDLVFEMAESVLDSPKGNLSPQISGRKGFFGAGGFGNDGSDSGPPSRRSSFGSNSNGPNSRSSFRTFSTDDTDGMLLDGLGPEGAESLNPGFQLDRALLEGIEVNFGEGDDEDDDEASESGASGGSGGYGKKLQEVVEAGGSGRTTTSTSITTSSLAKESASGSKAATSSAKSNGGSGKGKSNAVSSGGNAGDGALTSGKSAGGSKRKNKKNKQQQPQPKVSPLYKQDGSEGNVFSERNSSAAPPGLEPPPGF